MSGSAKSLIDVTPSSHSKNTMTKVVSEVLILREIVWLILLSAISFNAASSCVRTFFNVSRIRSNTTIVSLIE